MQETDSTIRALSVFVLFVFLFFGSCSINETMSALIVSVDFKLWMKKGKCRGKGCPTI